VFFSAFCFADLFATLFTAIKELSAVFGAGRFCLQKQQKTVLLLFFNQFTG
jgi:hypothetical protein